MRRGFERPALAPIRSTIRAGSKIKNSPQPAKLLRGSHDRVQDVYPDDRVSLREVGLRDACNSVKTFPSTAAKQPLAPARNMAPAGFCGVSRSARFLPASTFPQFADVREIGPRRWRPFRARTALRSRSTNRGVNESAGVWGCRDCLGGFRHEEHSQANATGRAIRRIATFQRLCELRDASAHKAIVNAAISMLTLGCRSRVRSILGK